MIITSLQYFLHFLVVYVYTKNGCSSILGVGKDNVLLVVEKELSYFSLFRVGVLNFDDTSRKKALNIFVVQLGAQFLFFRFVI